jgi:hypothetical protein
MMKNRSRKSRASVLSRWLTTMGHSAESNSVLQAKAQSLDKHYGPEGQISFELDSVDLCALARYFTCMWTCISCAHSHEQCTCGHESTCMWQSIHIHVHVPRCVWPCIHMHVELCMYMHETMYPCTCRNVSAYKWLWICIYLHEIRKTYVFPSHLLSFDDLLRF